MIPATIFFTAVITLLVVQFGSWISKTNHEINSDICEESDPYLSEFRSCVSEEKTSKVLYFWKPNLDEFDDYDDVATAYVIVESENTSASGLTVYARWDRTSRGGGITWQPNPWSERPVIRRLLNLCT